ncbi:M3 family metallopeptidase [Gryllotalpicola protaetiae]|uniref:M3 family peptidase n=1 Tax=Gryllotalpicola protaetiae TaxID=2419771 RepID=A0A387BR30_9MICO|nr:M3 family metallopeptidase [Gryllotalpicola protaetiae]AYG05138.1 M3 family peptidase [Gryllotalpicola protaetiae]
MSDASNPLLSPSTLEYRLPPFAFIADEHYEPAFEAAFAEHLAEIEQITANPDAPTFENTLVALERAGRTLRRVAAVFYNKSSADSTDATNALDERLAPRMAAHEDAINLNAALYARIRAVRDGLDARDDLTAESRYLVERYFTDLTLAGAGLDEEAKAQLSQLNQRISGLQAKFEKQLLADTNELAVVFDDATELDGLGDGELSAAAEAAKERGLEGKYLVTLVLPTGHPWLSSLSRTDVRHRIMTASRSRGAREGANDNRPLVLELVSLRAQRARLLGFASHADFVTAGQTAGSAANVAEMLGTLAPAAGRNARREHASLEATAGSPVGAADWDYWTEKVRVAEYDVDTTALRPYFEAERVLHDGVFFAATKLYGITFAERADLAGYHPDVRVFEVFDEDGSKLGLFLYDLYTRDSKRGGAWMNSLVDQSELLDEPTTVVVNNHNVPKPAAGEPTLLTFDEVHTLFHEFGHALHGLFGHSVYPRFSGTSVHRDFVEFPSQVNEMWMLWPEVLANYAKHHETGEPIPQDIVDRITASETFNEGFSTSEYLGAALLDQAWHVLSPEQAEAVTDVAAFEASALAAVGLDFAPVPPRYQSSYFAHTFSGGYDAQYYSYIWSEVLDADTVEWFKENGGLTRENGSRFRARLLGVGGTKDPIEAYVDFRGRRAELAPLLKRRGLLD